MDFSTNANDFFTFLLPNHKACPIKDFIKPNKSLKAIKQAKEDSYSASI